MRGPRTLLEWLIVIGLVAWLGLAVMGLPTVARECGKPLAEMPGWCLMLVGPSR